MLKIEVIKFEAQDVITASVAAPVECICGSDTWYHSANALIHGPNGAEPAGIEDHTRGSVKCYADSHPDCGEGGEVVN